MITFIRRAICKDETGRAPNKLPLDPLAILILAVGPIEFASAVRNAFFESPCRACSISAGLGADTLLHRCTPRHTGSGCMQLTYNTHTNAYYIHTLIHIAPKIPFTAWANKFSCASHLVVKPFTLVFPPLGHVVLAASTMLFAIRELSIV